jgi:DNA-binding response OmpR family regulator
VTAPSICQVEFGKKKFDWLIRPVVSDERTMAFRPFRLVPAQRVLLEGKKPFRLGSRALDLLIDLVEHPGEVVGRYEPMTRAWSRTFVEGGQPQVPDQRVAANAGWR